MDKTELQKIDLRLLQGSLVLMHTVVLEPICVSRNCHDAGKDNYHLARTGGALSTLNTAAYHSYQSRDYEPLERQRAPYSELCRESSLALAHEEKKRHKVDIVDRTAIVLSVVFHPALSFPSLLSLIEPFFFGQQSLPCTTVQYIVFFFSPYSISPLCILWT